MRRRRCGGLSRCSGAARHAPSGAPSSTCFRGCSPACRCRASTGACRGHGCGVHRRHRHRHRHYRRHRRGRRLHRHACRPSPGRPVLSAGLPAGRPAQSTPRAPFFPHVVHSRSRGYIT
ncbi:MAG: hypothetical protein CWE10_06995 [Symbiobacterium thermophilum]|uniref:Uncharacterized protein n=1 Tax=Symbiobacterium thermophilum TaxID=2734 RepID=A0A953LDZ3_SYMTR|nr:hypothetical protein [Symbiobacterium thermophilum]